MKQKSSELTEALKAIKNVADNPSWFRDTPHRWVTASLPLAYAVASNYRDYNNTQGFRHESIHT